MFGVVRPGSDAPRFPPPTTASDAALSVAPRIEEGHHSMKRIIAATIAALVTFGGV